jgi:beta-N-acetylhexosaminidase
VRRVELHPFHAAHAADVACMMTAHVVLEALDAERPATLSPRAVGLLREEVGYDGLVFTDDLEMKAIADHYAAGEVVDLALAAGVDGFLVCSRDDLRDSVLEALEAMPAARLEPSLARMARFKSRWVRTRAGHPAPAGPPYPAHRALASRLG